MINIIDKGECCGCTACLSICPKHCISMEADAEGFLYPVIDKTECVNCGKCEAICPIRNENKQEALTQCGYVIQAKDNTVRRDSAAGGVFSAMAEKIISDGGFVCGVALDEHYHAVHRIAYTVEKIGQFRSSKYMQSVIGSDVFIQIRILLEQGKQVLFSGTPCQVEGLIHFLGKEYTNLYTVDIVCHSVPSPKVFDKYKEYLEKIYDDKIVNLRFRDKYYGYGYPTTLVQWKNRNSQYHHGMESDPWLRAFFSGLCDRPSCYQCRFKTRYRRSDFTIWDCDTSDELLKQLNDDKGTTKLLIHSDKGKKLFNEIKEAYVWVNVSPDKLIKNGSVGMFNQIPVNLRRDNFMQDLQAMNGVDLFTKYFPLSGKAEMKHIFRVICYKIGIQRLVKKIYHMMK